MAELRDFMKKESAKLSDFVSEVSNNPMWSRPSAQSFAAHASLMSDDPVNTYDRVMSEMEVQGTSPTHQLYIDSLNRRAEEQSLRALEQVFGSGNPDDVEAAIKGYTNMPPQSQHELLEREAIAAPSSNETIAAEEFRIDTGNRLREINERRAIVQQVMNEELAKNDQGILSIAGDIAEMIVPVVGQRPTAQLMEELERDGWGDQFESFVLNGQAKQELSEMLRDVPEYQRLELAYKLVEAINNSPNAVLFNENTLEKANLLRIMLEEGYYTDTDRWIDNVIGVLDASAVGAPLAKMLGVGRAIRGASRGVSSVVQSMARRDAVKAPVMPHSASQALKDTNPEKARALHAAMVDDLSEEVANAAYGASRIDAIGHDIAGEVLQPFDVVKNKVDIPVQAPRILPPSPRVMDVATANGTVYLSEAERLGVTAKVINDFRAATGLQPRTAMMREGQVIDGVTGEFSNNTVNIRAIYGTVDGGFTRERITRVIENEIDRPTIRNRRGEEFFDTRGEGVQYHGSSTRLTNLYDSHYTSENIYGQGFYTSDAMDIVSGYSRKGRGGEEVVYRVDEKVPVNFYDLDSPLTDDVLKIAREAFPDDLPTEALDGSPLDTLSKLFDEIRAESRYMGLSADDVQGFFDSVRYELGKKGYGGYAHRGGRLTGHQDHQVKIYWEPETQIDITEVSKADFQAPPRTIEFEELGPSAVDDAIERTKIALRQYGIDDSDISILVRDGEHFTPIPSTLASRDLENFLVQVNFPYRVVADDIPLEQFNVKWNIFDRLGFTSGSKHGSIQRHVLPLSSMLQKHIVGGAAVTIDRGSLLAKNLLDLSRQATDIYDKLPASRKAAFFEEVKRANFEGRYADKARLIAEGFEPEELTLLDKWKEYWDTMYHLENRDKRMSLANQGYQRVVNPNGTQLDAKPIQRGGASGRVYDVDTDSVITLSREEIDELYEKGGHFSSLRNEVNIGGEVIGGEAGLPILVRNQPGGTISRGYRDWDNVLDYRPGYFSVKYDAEYFIVRTERRPDGQTYERAIAVSGDLKSAQQRARELAQEGGEYRVRADVKGEEREVFMDSVNLSGGRSAQRIRGERLEDATEANTSGFDMQYVMNPVDTMVNTARGISDRVAMREFIEVSKTRFLQQFGHMLPKNKFGQVMWPSKIEHIGRPGELASKELADARTTWEAINYWENGYVNAIDDTWKAALRKMGEIAGMRGLTRAEKAAFWAASQSGPLTQSRRLAFNLYLVLNPARQFIVQAHQSVQLAALRPAYVAKQLGRDFPALVAARLNNGAKGLPEALVKSSGRSKEQLEDMYEAYINSGLSASIDRQNLLRGSLLSAADDLTYKSQAVGALASTGRGVNKALNTTRRIGFDLGEEVNMMTSFLTFYDRALEANKGKKLSLEQLEEVTASARDFTYGMNFADDMPYNQNWLSMVFQFAQVPHKAALQFTFNRALTPMEKVRMASFNLAMYGVPPGSLLYSMVEPATGELPEEVREAIIFGLESYALNTAFSLMAGEDVKLSYNALQATDTVGLQELVTSIMTHDIGSLIAASPSGSLFFGNNPRLTEWARTVAKFTNFIPEDTEDPTTLPIVLKETFGLASGFSNAFKARLAYKLNEKHTAQGRVTKEGINLFEAIGTALGFETQHEMLNRYVSNELYEKSKEFEEDVKEQYRLTKMQLHRVGKDIRDPETAAQIMSYGWAAFEGTRAREIWEGLMRRDLEAGDHTMFNTLLRSETGGIMSRDEVRHLARSLPDGETKRGVLQILDDMDAIEELR